MCFDFAKHRRPKVPIRKLSPSGSIKTEVHAPGFYEFASKFYLIRARSARERHADGVPFRAPLGRFPLPYFGKAETGRTGAPQSAASNSPYKSSSAGLLFDCPRRGGAAAPAVQGRGGYPLRFLRNRRGIQGGQSPPWNSRQRIKFVIVRCPVSGGSMPALSMTLSIHAMLRPSFSMTSTPSVSCMTSPFSAP